MMEFYILHSSQNAKNLYFLSCFIWMLKSRGLALKFAKMTDFLVDLGTILEADQFSNSVDFLKNT